MVNIRIYGYSDTCWWYFLWECVLKILGHIVWSLQTGTWHWRAFVVPISDLIHQRILQILCLFVCLFGWINPGQSNPWSASTRGARSSPKTVLLSARKPTGEYSKQETPSLGGFLFFVTNDVIFLSNWNYTTIHPGLWSAESGNLSVRLQVGWAQVSARICWWLVNSLTQT